ncbi:hypothetical protein HNQ65_004233 [Prosthecobacter vanneervenii]|uniref:Uncharacterized protein n=1 Tax=Prosthecobacter vanneervenii TaxID=48466 RepID=A0A7W7YEC9_9BACT|nr:hypothetical protein [Prosthecobacter vanneervenii]
MLFDEDLRAPHAEYVLGFRGLEAKPFDKIPDFSRATDFDAYLASLTIAER